MRQQTDYQTNLIEALKDVQEAAAYLNAAIGGGDAETFLLGLRNVVEAHGGRKAVADKANINEESLHRTLSHGCFSELHTWITLLHGMGLRLSVEPDIPEQGTA
ncbi:helix-turn-helix domain-containing transcriptional regulator [Geomonas edaphica]|uniref:helix-turn-helix domain-containing transcriptional regulator n=1 Tax=Geomonas edaphica TaxID=2570226 RepID=UPI0010A7C0F7|nr:transcriptional regulator [Geomonas edaphica]